MNNEERILDILSVMQGDISELKTDVAGLKTDVASLSNEVLKINIKLENNIEPNIRLLAEGHATIIERMSPKERMDELEEEVRFLKSVMRQMNEDIQQLKQAQ